MSVNSYRELARVNSHKIGESPKLKRRWVVTLDNPDTTISACLAAINVYHGTAHPEVAGAICTNLEVNEQYEGSRYHVEIVADYEFPPGLNESPTVLPWLRPDKWTFQTQGVAVPALFYYDGTTQKPLTNSAGDYFEGLTVDEAQQKIIIESNRQAFPSALAAAVTNCVNDGTYAGFPIDCVKVQGISGERVSEQINNQTVWYWKIKSELLGRQTGWNLLLPDVGYNYISAGTKRRAYVVGPPPDNAQVATANPVGLNGEGGLITNNSLPAILTRRVYKRITMSTYFGNPPT